MDRIILEHFKPLSFENLGFFDYFFIFLSLKPFKIPFLIKKGNLAINNKFVYISKKTNGFEGIIINDKEEGIGIYWFNPNAKRSEGLYVNGKSNGLWLSYNINGKLNNIKFWKDGLVDIEKTFK